MKAPLAIFLAVLGLIFLAADAFVTGGAITASGAEWLLPAGMACWCASWLVFLIPVP